VSNREEDGDAGGIAVLSGMERLFAGEVIPRSSLSSGERADESCGTFESEFIMVCRRSNESEKTRASTQIQGFKITGRKKHEVPLN
jgi:hypothetical protein